jgi:uncharacterized protein YcfJ
MNKIIAVSLTGILAVMSTSALAARWHDGDDAYYARARVLKVEPVTTTVHIAVPQRECYQQEIHTPVYSHRRDGAALVGGLVGGILGHNLGHGRGGTTLAGAIIGSAVGRSVTRNTDGYYEAVSYVDRCEVHTRYQTQQRLLGYDVTYRYHGQVSTTRMHYDPGKFIQVRVDVSPVVE